MTGVVERRRKRPDPAEWDEGWKTRSGVEHRALLLIDGVMQAALRDASWFDHPDVRKPKYVHVVVASRRIRMASGNWAVKEAAACDPARIPLDVEGLVWEARKVATHLRCTRPACASLFAAADDVAPKEAAS